MEALAAYDQLFLCGEGAEARNTEKESSIFEQLSDGCNLLIYL